MFRGVCYASFKDSTLYRFTKEPVAFCSRTIFKPSMKPLMKDDLIHTACALSIFALFSMNASAQDPAPGNPAKPNEYNGQMTMSLSIPFSQPEQAAPKDNKTPQVLSAKEQEIEALNAQISQMQTLIKNLQTSLKQSPDASSAVPATVSAVPVSAVPAIPDVSLKKGLQSKIWILLLAAAVILWLLKNKATTNRGIFEDVDEEAWSHVGAISIKTPAYVENRSDAADSTSKGLSASLLHRKQVIEPAEVDSMIEEAELYAIHGHLNNAMEILNNIILQYPERIEVWLLLLSIFRGNARQFEVIARKFLQTVGRNDAWREIQQVGCCIDPENPLYFDTDMQTPQVKAEKRRALGNILVDIQALSKEDLKKSLSQFDHLRDGKLGSLLLDKGFIGQRELDEALKLQNKESKKCQPAKPLESMVRPRSISDVLIRMGAVTEPELEHVLADFDPKRDGHCGNYLVSCGLITQKQLYSALLQQLSGVMEEAETAQNHAARRA